MTADVADWTRPLQLVTGGTVVDYPDWTEAAEVVGGSSGGITDITSTDGSVTITNPTGPTTDLSVSGGGGIPDPFTINVTGVNMNVHDSTPTIVASLQMTNTTPGCEIDTQDLIIIKSEQSNLELRADNASVLIQGDTTGFGGITIDASSVNIAPTSGDKVGFYNPAGGPVGRQTITGSRGGNVALANLLTALANLGLIANSTTP